ncbi:hypothetical protein [Bacillus cereus]|uniref:Uncharacterized protein n=1 Tax=Bacillus cereus TaxID=1396 RepID=A0ABD4LM30_BACCE|nr:hypothetical protein [Bacillus cereus]MBK1611721.1 hypothetical protein [Bacillus cereus]
MTSLKNVADVKFFDKETGEEVAFTEGTVESSCQSPPSPSDEIRSMSYSATLMVDSFRALYGYDNRSLNDYLRTGIEARMHREFLRRYYTSKRRAVVFIGG